MASQSSVDEVATPIENPVTPQADELDLPSKADLPTTSSLTSSMLVVGSSAVRPSSITPPPSSQAPPRIASAPRSITPDTSAADSMSSPPPTIPNGTKRELPNVAGLTTDQLAQYTKQQLIEVIEKVKAENHTLDASASEARMSAAHYKLQYRLLTIESEEALKRMEVEHDITRREVEVLQGTGRESANLEYTQKLKAYCKSLEEELYAAHRRLEKAKRLIESKEDQMSDAKAEIARLHDRIRQNREHINVLRSPGGPLHSTPKAPATPLQYHRSAPRYTPLSNRQIRYPAQDNQERFNALLLAGSVLSGQENNSAPSTPTVARRPDPRTPNKHNRGVQSLSSFPTTPGSARPMTANSTLLPAAEFSQSGDARIAAIATNSLQQLTQSQSRRRKSRDSTISASDHEEIVHANTSYREESEEVQESQASQSATEMLRADPRESFEVAASRTHTPLPDKPMKTNQSKLFVPVSKVGTEKRKRDEDYTGSVKKARSDAEAIGLGIGFEHSRG